MHGDWARPGFRALVVYRLGAWRLTKTGFTRKALYLPMRALQRYVRNQYGIELFPTATIGRRVWIPHHGSIVIHEYAQIGDGVMIRHGCTLGAADHWSPDSAPVIEDDVEFGAGAIVLGAVRVGRRRPHRPECRRHPQRPAGGRASSPRRRGRSSRLDRPTNERGRRGTRGASTRLLEEGAAHGRRRPGALCVKLARACRGCRRSRPGRAWLLRVVDAEDAFRPWQAAAALLPRARAATSRSPPPARRATSDPGEVHDQCNFRPFCGSRLLRSGSTRALRGPYGQFDQELIEPASGPRAFGPDVVLFAVHEGRAPAPRPSATGRRTRSPRRWDGGRTSGRPASAWRRVVQPFFSSRPETPLGHLGARTARVARVDAHRLTPARRARGDETLPCTASASPRSSGSGVGSTTATGTWPSRRWPSTCSRFCEAHGGGDRRRPRPGKEVPRAGPRQHALGRRRG